MKTPFLEINLKKIENNATKLNNIFKENNMDIVFITKGTSANIDVIKTVKNTGIKYFGDSRMDNIIKVKNEIPDINYTLIRIPKLSEISEMVEYCDCSLQSQLEVIKVTSNYALENNKVHNIILMIDVGDLREGVMVEDVLDTVKEILTYKGVKLVGIGTNVGCYGSIMPSVENTQILVDIKNQIKNELNYDIQFISGGSTCTTDLLFKGILNTEINLMRIGEAIMLGEDSTNDKKLDGFEDDAFIINAEIIELKNKPSFPIGERGKDAFGRVNEYIDYGNIDRAILAIGRQDVVIEALDPLDENINILGGSSDHMILDVTKCNKKYKLGDIISFRCAYSAVLAATTSKYVDIKLK
ncbi:putative amino acid racemase [Bacilli bacterium PM5-9]|nr:putative amino acid racemase [Bacilli bacterium PM5-9]